MPYQLLLRPGNLLTAVRSSDRWYDYLMTTLLMMMREVNDGGSFAHDAVEVCVGTRYDRGQLIGQEQ